MLNQVKLKMSKNSNEDEALNKNEINEDNLLHSILTDIVPNNLSDNSCDSFITNFNKQVGINRDNSSIN